MIYLRREIQCHYYSIINDEGEEEVHTFWPMIGYWNGKDWGRLRPLKCDVSAAKALTQEEAQAVVDNDTTDIDKSFINYYALSQPADPTKEDWEKLRGVGI